MIPYEELCTALAGWREKNGLANGPSARPPQGIVAPPPAAAPPEAAPAVDSGELVFAASISAGFGDRVPTDEGFGGEPPTALTRSPFVVEPTAGETPILPPGPTFDETLLEGEEMDAPTAEIAAPEERSARRDITNELQLDDIVDESSDKLREPN